MSLFFNFSKLYRLFFFFFFFLSFISLIFSREILRSSSVMPSGTFQSSRALVNLPWKNFQMSLIITDGPHLYATIGASVLGSGTTCFPSLFLTVKRPLIQFREYCGSLGGQYTGTMFLRLPIIRRRRFGRINLYNIW